MTSSLQAAKRVRQNEKRRLRNRAKSSAMKSSMKRVEGAIAAGDAAAVKLALDEAYSRIDKAARNKVIHPNTAARRKALIARHAAAAGKSAKA